MNEWCGHAAAKRAGTHVQPGSDCFQPLHLPHLPCLRTLLRREQAMSTRALVTHARSRHTAGALADIRLSLRVFARGHTPAIIMAKSSFAAAT